MNYGFVIADDPFLRRLALVRQLGRLVADQL